MKIDTYYRLCLKETSYSNCFTKRTLRRYIPTVGSREDVGEDEMTANRKRQNITVQDPPRRESTCRDLCTLARYRSTLQK